MEVITQLQGPEYSHLTPLFIVHAISGLAIPFLYLHPLSEDDERPVYGISSPMHCADVDDFVFPSKLRGLSEYYVEKIREIQPYGPYLLAGWSMGGMIAMDMAHLLQSQGESILKVIMIDSGNPEAFPTFPDEAENKLFARIIFSRALNPVPDAEPLPECDETGQPDTFNGVEECLLEEDDDDDDDRRRSTWGTFFPAMRSNTSSMSEYEAYPSPSTPDQTWTPGTPATLECSSRPYSDCESVTDPFENMDPFARFREDNFNDQIFVNSADDDKNDKVADERRLSYVTVNPFDSMDVTVVNPFDNIDPFARFRDEGLEEVAMAPKTKEEEERRTSCHRRRQSVNPRIMEAHPRRQSFLAVDTGTDENRRRRRQSCFVLGTSNMTTTQDRRRSCLLSLAANMTNHAEPPSRRGSHVSVCPPPAPRQRPQSCLLSPAADMAGGAAARNRRLSCVGFRPPQPRLQPPRERPRSCLFSLAAEMAGGVETEAEPDTRRHSRLSFCVPPSQSVRRPSGLAITTTGLPQLTAEDACDSSWLSPLSVPEDSCDDSSSFLTALAVPEDSYDSSSFLSPHAGAEDRYHRRQSCISVASVASHHSCMTMANLEDGLGPFASLCGGEGMDEEEFLTNIKQHVQKGLRLISNVEPGELLPVGVKSDFPVVLVKCQKEGAWTRSPERDELDSDKARAIRELMKQDTMLWDTERFAKFETIPFSGDHDTAFGPETVGELSDILRQALEDVV
ncbi:hypothetical protein ACRALDRAFT_1068467 [Sodiomyces alcalophilus JCM 7366]|uniref:uncharacterized protein n=1 Tax=Sodiomyces alcalophilus JCM 7366 TaxID=591952 RepID=UPI0039B48884